MKRTFSLWTVLFAIAGTFFVLGSASQAADPGKSSAVAVLHPTQGNKAAGAVRFIKTQDGVKIMADLQGLPPGKHGFHIHEFGDCSAADATSAGGHFNPTNHPHAAPTVQKRHVGDLGNIEAKADGSAHMETTDKMIQLEGQNGVMGRAVVVHAGEDDLKTQPTGDSGARVACGVIGHAKQ
ncbi:MAG: superoxide dismutase family protein [Desulfobacteraceae bacterium]|nr:MAG: superoxide dismutase family protein [Desulfobacteraceae bacterium]